MANLGPEVMDRLTRLIERFDAEIQGSGSRRRAARPDGRCNR